MKFESRLIAVLAGAAILTLGVTLPSIVTALPRAEISKIAKEVTVEIETKNSGSGVIIGKKKNNYYVLTAWHVVQYDDWEYAVKTSDFKRYPVKRSSVKRLPGVDLALLQFTSDQNYNVATIGNSDEMTEGNSAYVAGFPDPPEGISQRIYDFKTGKITGRYTQPVEEGYALVYDNETRTGNSGGPVLDKKGRVVGIHGLGLTDAGNKIGRNVAIPMKTFLNLLPQTKINLSLQIDNSPLTVPQPFANSPLTVPQPFANSPSPASAPNSYYPASGVLPTRPSVLRSNPTSAEPICAGNRC